MPQPAFLSSTKSQNLSTSRRAEISDFGLTTRGTLAGPSPQRIKRGSCDLLPTRTAQQRCEREHGGIAAPQKGRGGASNHHERELYEPARRQRMTDKREF